jgi:hypothetical protein
MLQKARNPDFLSFFTIASGWPMAKIPIKPATKDAIRPEM